MLVSTTKKTTSNTKQQKSATKTKTKPAVDETEMTPNVKQLNAHVMNKPTQTPKAKRPATNDTETPKAKRQALDTPKGSTKKKATELDEDDKTPVSQFAKTYVPKQSKASKTSTKLSEIKGFLILPVIMNNEIEAAGTDLTYTHYLYIRRHTSQGNAEPQRTLFVTNIPVACSTQSLIELFQEFGAVKEVQFKVLRGSQQSSAEDDFRRDILDSLEMLADTEGSTAVGEVALHGRGSFALVEFATHESLDRVMSMVPAERYLVGLRSPLGVDMWFQQYLNMFPDRQRLQTAVDSFIAKFEADELAEREAIAAQTNLPDEEGFVLVTRHSRRNKNKGEGGVTVTAARPEEVKQLKPKEQTLSDFYRFQHRQTKRDEIAVLRQKFEQDKQRILQMKQARKFKPY